MNVLRWFIAVVLLSTGIGKALDIRGFALVVGTYQVLPESLLLPAAFSLAAVELLLGVWLCSGRALRIAAAAATALHVVFIGWISVALIRGLSIENCGCFGVFFARPLTPWALLEDGVMLASCLALYFMSAKTASMNARPQGDKGSAGMVGSSEISMPASSSNARR